MPYTSIEGPVTKAGALRVVVVDDHILVRKGLAALINFAPDMTVCSESDTVDGGLACIGRDRPDVAVIDLTLGQESGLDIVTSLAVSKPALPVLVLSMHEETLHAERAIAAGARGYIMKDQARQDLVDAIRAVARGDIYLSPRMRARIMARAEHASGDAASAPVSTHLTGDERRVFGLLGRGNTPDEIARIAELALVDVEAACVRIEKKLGLDSRHDLTRAAMDWRGVGETEPLT